MAASGSSVWPTLLAGNRARASEVETKFDWIEANVLPMLSGSTTDLVYDLGTSSARWRNGFIDKLYATAIAPTTTSNGVAIGTTTVANASDVALDIALPRAVIMPRVTTTQKNNFSGINGMIVYDSTLGYFQFRENGSWVRPGGSVFQQQPMTTGSLATTTTTVLNIASGGGIFNGISVSFENSACTIQEIRIYVDGVIVLSSSVAWQFQGAAAASNRRVQMDALGQFVALDKGTNTSAQVFNSSPGPVGWEFASTLAVHILANTSSSQFFTSYQKRL